MNDPTYVTAEIKKNPVWHAAWVLSEIYNDNAPIGWGRYISTAKRMSEIFKTKENS